MPKGLPAIMDARFMDQLNGEEGEPIHGNGSHDNSNKRKADEGSDAPARSKRSRYISIAWLVLTHLHVELETDTR